MANSKNDDDLQSVLNKMYRHQSRAEFFKDLGVVAFATGFTGGVGAGSVGFLEAITSGLNSDENKQIAEANLRSATEEAKNLGIQATPEQINAIINDYTSRSNTAGSDVDMKQAAATAKYATQGLRVRKVNGEDVTKDEIADLMVAYQNYTSPVAQKFAEEDKKRLYQGMAIGGEAGAAVGAGLAVKKSGLIGHFKDGFLPEKKETHAKDIAARRASADGGKKIS